MNTYRKWIDNGAKFDEGLILYIAHMNSNANLIRAFKRSSSESNQLKLRYELRKLYDIEIIESSNALEVESKSIKPGKEPNDKIRI